MKLVIRWGIFRCLFCFENSDGSMDYQAVHSICFVFGFQRHYNLILNSVDQPYLARIRMIKCMGYHCSLPIQTIFSFSSTNFLFEECMTCNNILTTHLIIKEYCNPDSCFRSFSWTLIFFFWNLLAFCWSLKILLSVILIFRLNTHSYLYSTRPTLLIDPIWNLRQKQRLKHQPDLQARATNY